MSEYRGGSDLGQERPIGASSERRSIETLQIGRAFAAIAVVFFHVEVTLGLAKYLGREVFPIFRSGNSGVEYFFVLSGFVMVMAHGGDFGRAGVVGPFLWKRFRRLYPALWVVLASQFLLLLIVPQERVTTSGLLWITIKDFLILPWGGPTLLSVEWTLRHEVLFYLVFSMALFLPKRRWHIGAVAVCLVLAGSFTTLPQPLDRLGSGYNLLFAFGIVAALLHERRALTKPGLAFVLGVILFGGTWLALAYDLWDKSVVAVWSYGLGAALVVAGAAGYERISNFSVPKLLRLLGDASYSIYLVHYPVVSVMCKLLMRIGSKQPIPDAIVFFIIAGVAVAAGVVFHLVVEKPWLARLPNRLGRQSGREGRGT